MLRELRIRDLAILEDVSVSFGAGLNVLSGETGAGKSIVLRALGLILGGRGDAALVRTGRVAAEVEARFDREPTLEGLLTHLDVLVPEDDDGVVIRRVITAQGRGRAYVCGTAVPVAALQDLAAVLVDYGSQHEHQVLLDEARHVDILDDFGQHAALRVRVKDGAASLRSIQTERARLAALEAQSRSREDWLRFQLDELSKVAPEPEEDQKLESERGVLRLASRLSAKAREAEERLTGGSHAASDRLAEAAHRLREIAQTDDSLAPLRDAVMGALDIVQDVGRELGQYARRRREDPSRLQEIEDRLAEIKGLARKHRTDHAGLVALAERLRVELDEIEHVSVHQGALLPKEEAARRELSAACEQLTRARSEAAARLTGRVEEELASLAMPRARFVVPVVPADGHAESLRLGEEGGGFASATGADRVAFELSANPGETPRPLARVASGGELSRILLALRRALAGASAVQCCVFDEVDTGMGGATGEMIGRKLQEISLDGQVLCVTHLPQIAARADVHLRVEKSVEEGRTRTAVRTLTDADRLDELVRMLAGGTDESARAFARDLLQRARVR